MARVRKRISRLLAKHGVLSAMSPEEASRAASESVEEPETLDLFKAASIRGWVCVSEPPRPVEAIGKQDTVFSREKKPFCAEAEGFTLHAGVRISSVDRAGLEILCRYILRPPFAEDRLRQLSDGRILYEFRRARFDGASHIVLKPVELLEKLAALVPPPRFHLVHYSGVFAPHARRRSDVVPIRIEIDETEGDDCGGHRRRKRRQTDDLDSSEDRSRSRRKRKSRTDWATLLKRTLGIDVLACPKCSGRMVVLACITEPETIRKILRAMHLWEEPLELRPARPPPDLAFESDQDR